MFCQNCGNRLEENAVICKNCGASVVNENQNSNQENLDNRVNIDKEPQQQQQQSQYNSNEQNPQQAPPVQNMVQEDKPNILVNILSFCCFPILGIVMFFVWKDTYPRAAKSALIFSLVSIALGVIAYIILFTLGIFAGVADTTID